MEPLTGRMMQMPLMISGRYPFRGFRLPQRWSWRPPRPWMRQRALCLPIAEAAPAQ